MTEPVKTLIFVGLAAVVTLGAWLTRPRDITSTPPALEMLFPDFDDPQEAARMVITRFDEDLGQLYEFELTRDDDGRWTIPSYSGYPADAEEQMRDVATSLVDLKALDVASEIQKDHSTFGVLEPDQDELERSSEGVGLLVVVQNKGEEDLAKLIIGGKVKNAENQYFVRIPNQDPVYVVNIDPDKFSTEFDDWIEDDLLKLRSMDIETVTLNDYVVRDFQLRPRMDITMSDDNGTWKLDSMNTYGPGSKPGEVVPVPASLRPGEELNKEKLDDLKSAVDDLKIVTVRRKPEGLKADLTAGEDFLKDESTIRSLTQLGFFAGEFDGKIELRAANGETRVTLNDGVEYLLRFGDIASGQQERYLFVMAQLDESKIEKPELEELPELKEPAGPPTPDDDKGDDDKKGDDNKEDEAQAELKAERDRIQKENDRKTAEYNDKLEEARKKVQDLNARFANWYYVVSDDVYKRIQLNRADVIRIGEGSEDQGYGLDAFRTLEEQGIDPPPAPANPAGGFPGGGFPGGGFPGGGIPGAPR